MNNGNKGVANSEPTMALVATSTHQVSLGPVGVMSASGVEQERATSNCARITQSNKKGVTSIDVTP
jgi:hypothetical protein